MAEQVCTEFHEASQRCTKGDLCPDPFNPRHCPVATEAVSAGEQNMADFVTDRIYPSRQALQHCGEA